MISRIRNIGEIIREDNLAVTEDVLTRGWGAP